MTFNQWFVEIYSRNDSDHSLPVKEKMRLAYQAGVAAPNDEKRINWMQDNLALIRDIGWLAGQDLRNAIDAAMSSCEVDKS